MWSVLVLVLVVKVAKSPGKGEGRVVGVERAQTFASRCKTFVHGILAARAKTGKHAEDKALT